MAREPSETEITRRAIEGRLLDVRTSFAGQIVSFDANTMRATVRAAVRVQGVDLDSDGEVDTLPDFTDVPVVFPSAGFGILFFPLAPGDPVRLEFSEEDDQEFYWDAGAQVPVNPTNARRHGGHVVCRPEGKRGVGSLGSENPARGFLGKPGGPSLSWDGSFVYFGDSSATDFVALAQKVLDELNAIATAFSGHTHTVTGMCPVGGGALTLGQAQAGPTYNPNSVAATKAKAK